MFPQPHAPRYGRWYYTCTCCPCVCGFWRRIDRVGWIFEHCAEETPGRSDCCLQPDNKRVDGRVYLCYQRIRPEPISRPSPTAGSGSGSDAAPSSGSGLGTGAIVGCCCYYDGCTRGCRICTLVTRTVERNQDLPKS